MHAASKKPLPRLDGDRGLKKTSKPLARRGRLAGCIPWQESRDNLLPIPNPDKPCRFEVAPPLSELVLCIFCCWRNPSIRV